LTALQASTIAIISSFTCSGASSLDGILSVSSSTSLASSLKAAKLRSPWQFFVYKWHDHCWMRLSGEW
jgi:hypothetical protein